MPDIFKFRRKIVWPTSIRVVQLAQVDWLPIWFVLWRATARQNLKFIITFYISKKFTGQKLKFGASKYLVRRYPIFLENGYEAKGFARVLCVREA